MEKMMKLLLLLLLSTSVMFAKYDVGQKAYNFYLPQLMEKGSYGMKTYNNRLILLNLWASWCDGCKKEMPLFDTIGKKFSSKKFRLVTINVDNKRSKGVKFVKKLRKKLGHKPHMAFFYDKKKSTAKAYRASGFPLSILIKNGKIIKRYVGSFDESNEKQLIKDIQRQLR